MMIMYVSLYPSTHIYTYECQIGRLNLLTPTRVAAAAKEIRSGEIVPVKYVKPTTPIKHH